MSSHTVADHARFIDIAIQEARIGYAEGGIPIGAALVVGDEVLATGRNRRVQLGSVIRHGETDCLENAGRLTAAVYRRSTMYTTLSPCYMCAGTILMYRVPRVVIAEHRHFCETEHFLREHGVEVTVLHDPEATALMERFVTENPSLWAEDIGEPAPAP